MSEGRGRLLDEIKHKFPAPPTVHSAQVAWVVVAMVADHKERSNIMWAEAIARAIAQETEAKP